MKNIVSKIKKVINQVLGLIPSPLPVGMTEFNQWSDSIINTYNLPGTERDKRYMLASMIIRFGETTAFKSKFFFFLALRSAAAKQIAGANFAMIRQEQQAEQAAAIAAAAKQAEVPASSGIDGRQEKTA